VTWEDSEFVSKSVEESTGMARFVVGVGNVLLKDEGIGCHVLQALRETDLSDVEIIDGGTSLDALQLCEDAEKLIIVDAVRGGGTPGQIYRFRPEDITLEEEPILLLHDMSFVNSLKLMRLWHNIGEAIIIGIEPRDIGWGLELSPELQEKLPRVVDAVLAELGSTSPEGEKKC
jgi:hydrogenase maturation protease